MQIDFVQIVTHIVGFLIALWLLRKYAWNSLLGIVQKRRDTIASSFEEIEQGKAAVEQQKQQYELELQKIEETRRDKIQEAAREAEKLASEIREDARREALAEREKTKKEISIELDKANEVLKDRIVAAVLQTTEGLLGEKLDPDKHNRLIDDFLSKVKVN